jgi:hypothetical protein
MKSINFYFIIIASLKPNTVKSVYKGHSREPENVTFMISCPLYTAPIHNPNPNPNHNPNPNPILGHNFIAPDTISYRNLYKILSGGTL